MSHMVSPEQLHNHAKVTMLDGREPHTLEDWQLCANFWAANIAFGLEVSALPLLGLIMECPLSKQDLEEIARFQANSKKRAKASMKRTASTSAKKGA